MREITLSSSEHILTADDAVEEAFQMDEESFRAFYARTARPLWSYLRRISGDPTLADDLLQESYLRFLRGGLKGPKGLAEMDEAHQKNYLFRIATNLARDHWRGAKAGVPLVEMASSERTAESVERRSDLAGALERLKPRERELLWLAYVEGSSHKEIAEIAGVRAASVRLMLFRARRKLAELLRKRGCSAAL